MGLLVETDLNGPPFLDSMFDLERVVALVGWIVDHWNDWVHQLYRPLNVMDEASCLNLHVVSVTLV